MAAAVTLAEAGLRGTGNGRDGCGSYVPEVGSISPRSLLGKLRIELMVFRTGCRGVGEIFVGSTCRKLVLSRPAVCSANCALVDGF